MIAALGFKACALSLLLLSVLADDIIRAGTIYLTTDGSQTSQKLKVDCESVVASDGRSIFEFDLTGFLKLSQAEKYLKFNDAGRLISVCRPHYGFNLTTIKQGRKVKRKVSYKDDEVFELCADNSIGYKSGCAGATPISFTYIDLISPV